MNTKWIKLLEYLLSVDTVTSSKILANHLNLSTRTVRNYIQDINTFCDEKIIFSTPNGYYIQNKQKVQSLLVNNREDTRKMLPQTENERVDYILSKFLNAITSIDVFDLTDELGISYTTLKKTIKTANDFLVEFDLKLATTNNQLFLSGQEKNKRGLLKYYLYNNSTEDILSIKYLESFFGKDIIQPILNFLEQLKQSFQLTLNDFALRNTTLHLAIIATRNRDGEYLTENDPVDLIEPYFDSYDELKECIKTFYQNNFTIDLKQSEINQISILIQTSANDNKLVDGKMLHIVENILEQLEKFYYFPINHQTFVAPFALHLKGLYKRIELAKFNHNPLLKDIKIASPVLYDIALFISNIINTQKKTSLPEDEVAYIALHLGNAINEEKTGGKRIETVIIAPDYLEISGSLQEAIEKDFHSSLNIVAVVRDASTIDSFSNARLLISISDIYISTSDDVVITLISPFYTNKDREKIEQSICTLNQIDKKNFMVKHLDKFINKELFFTDITFEDKYDILYFMSDQMYQLGYVHKGFQEEVVTREKMSSTAFEGIAIPHSIAMNSPHTMLSIYVNKNEIDWDNRSVKLVLLISISRKDSAIFREMYEDLMDTLSEDDALDKIANANNFEDFKRSMLSLWY